MIQHIIDTTLPWEINISGGVSIDTALTDPELFWETDYIEVKTDIHDNIPNTYLVYRKDTNGAIGLVQKRNLSLVQNSQIFRCIPTLLIRQQHLLWFS